MQQGRDFPKPHASGIFSEATQEPEYAHGRRKLSFTEGEFDKIIIFFSLLPDGSFKYQQFQ